MTPEEITLLKNIDAKLTAFIDYFKIGQTPTNTPNSIEQRAEKAAMISMAKFAAKRAGK